MPKKPDPLDKLEAAAIKAERLRQLTTHPGWEELMKNLQQAQEILDRNLLNQARAGTLTERQMHRYEDTSRAYRLFRENPERAAKELETLLKKIERAQRDEGDA